MKRIILLVAVAACAQEPQQGHAPLGTAKVPYLFSPSTGESKRPTLLVLPGGGDPGASYKQWSSAIPQGWTVLMPLVPGLSDAGAKAVEAVLGHATEPAGIDRSRVYLAGAGSATPEVFYTLARLPGLFAAALAVEGNPMPAVNSNRLFAINTQLSPLLWVNPPEGLETVQTKLKDAEYRFEIAKNLGTMQIFQWLFQNQLAQNPLKVDCETHSPSFARCFWVEVSQFNLKKKNDVVPSTRVQPGTGASLDLGGFGYDPKAPGPGLLVAWYGFRQWVPIRTIGLGRPEKVTDRLKV